MMSLNPCSRSIAVKTITEKKGLDEAKVIEFFKILEKKSTSRVYVSVIRRFFDIREKDSLDIVEILSKLDILKPVYKIKISDTLLPSEYEYLRDIPENIFIEDLYEDITIDFSKHVFLFFRVIKDE
ncbi:hypothetical protein [Enterococcus hirae]|uniref:hypothetical protein n=1 Tax=Enterococcus hirae TaxID=1354 RepID=UPI0006B1E55B|nr:hypothetical protein [Enterococcus hirae]ASV82005.1 hypothetical protein A6J73_07805 [Enterococcus hirae]MBE8786459.1 hypothetical protein [Enterococcus hirae]MBE8804965.1 hypothetical protein [Enterococcus hirae]MDD9145331.1 hypothetical protein [Enterococcus hirae]